MTGAPGGTPNAALEGAIELLERSLGYTRMALADVRPDLLGRPTPCTRWNLQDLLTHMDDTLDAFTEAAVGRVEVAPVPPSGTTVDSLRDKACALLGAWTGAVVRPGRVEVGDLGLDAPLLVGAAALEITLHGWDVAQATGRRTPIPGALAGGLLALAGALVGDADRGVRFGSARPVPAGAAAEQRLLAWVGRAGSATVGRVSTGPAQAEQASGNPSEAPTRQGLAS